MISRRISTTTSEPRILMVEDDVLVGRAWRRTFRETGFAVDVAQSLAAARSALAKQSYRIVFVDLLLGDGYGATLLPLLAETRPRPIVAVVSGHLDCERIVALYGHCDIIVPKPIAPRTLIELVSRLTAPRISEQAIELFCQHHGLSARESDVIRAAARGGSIDKLATIMECGSGSVKTYWQRIFGKTGQRSQDAVLAAVVRFEDLRRRS